MTKGRMAMVSSLPGLVQRPGGGHPDEILLCFEPYPPYSHFKRPEWPPAPTPGT
ncbi:hypothetical protein ACIQCD_09380 [Streptomyces sp. NPDC093250]|uniref:hypothetical protein n=1 Tax=unclassified Streptomyces TaxID=2593676 RepID=UPI0033D2973F